MQSLRDPLTGRPIWRVTNDPTVSHTHRYFNVPAFSPNWCHVGRSLLKWRNVEHLFSAGFERALIDYGNHELAATLVKDDEVPGWSNRSDVDLCTPSASGSRILPTGSKIRAAFDVDDRFVPGDAVPGRGIT